MLRVIGNDQNLPRQEHAVASGTLTNGKPVIINSDGTVSVPTSTSSSVGSTVNFESAQVEIQGSAYDSNSNRVVFAYRDYGNSNYATAVVGTVSGTSISFGTPVVFDSASIGDGDACFDSTNNKIVISWKDGGNSDRGTAIVGTVDSSDNSISFGTKNQYDTSTCVENKIDFDSNSGKVAIVYRDGGSSYRGACVIGTVSGTSISFGSQTLITSGTDQAGSINCAFDSAGKLAVAYRNSGDADGDCVIGTISGTSISFGSIVNFANVNEVGSITYDSTNDKIFITFRDTDNSNYLTGIVGTISGTSISFGTKQVIDNASSFVYPNGAGFDAASGNIVVSYRSQASGNPAKLNDITISGTSFTVGTQFEFESGDARDMQVVYDSTAEKTVIGFRDTGDSSHGKALVYTSSSQNLTSENYIGIARSGAASGAGAIIDTKGAIAEIPEVYYDLANASYDSVSFSVASQSSYTFDFSFADSGTKLYAQKQFNGGTIYQYTLSSAYDLSTASYANKSYSFANGESGFVITPDGSTLYISANTGDAVYRYTFGTAFDVSTLGSGTSMFSTSSVDTQPDKCKFNSNGTKFFLLGRNNKRIYEYAVSTAYDLSSASYSNNSLLLSGQAAAPLGFNFNSDGTKLFVSDNTTDTIFQYNLSTAYDITSASYSNISFSVAGQDSTPSGIDFNSTGSKLFILGNSSNTVYQYNTETSLTAGQSYFVQTDGTLSETADNPSVFAGTAVSATKLIVKG